MIELKTLTREDRTLVTMSCEPFLLDYTETPAFKEVHEYLLSVVGYRQRKELWVFITACAKALKHGLDGSQFSRRKDNYTEANKIHGKKISYVKSLRVIDKLESDGYISIYNGFYDHDYKLGIKSCFLMDNILIKLFQGINYAKFGAKRPIETLVEIRDGTTKERITELSKLRGIKCERSFVESYNKHIGGFDIRCKGKKVCAVYKRVYSDDLFHAGRWYTQGSFQTAPVYLRPRITIDGYKTTEVDYKQIHPRIIYTLEGISKPRDWEPYQVDTFKVPTDGKDRSKEVRGFLKMGLMCLLYATDIGKACGALYKKLEKDITYNKEERQYTGIYMGKGDYKKLMNSLIERNKEIAHWFFKERLWAVLQNFDSRITAEILKDFMELGKCILPWHDSYVVEVSDRSLLIRSMNEAWESIFKTKNNCYVDVEF